MSSHESTPTDPSTVGAVESFDREVGLGVVVGDDGVRLPFHCIDITDGSRDIAVGTRVRYIRRLKLGRVEAAQLVAQ